MIPITGSVYLKKNGENKIMKILVTGFDPFGGEKVNPAYEAVSYTHLICEGMYGEDGKEAKAREYKHMTFYEAARLAKEANPKQLWLTHYSPSLTRPEEFMDKVREIFPRAKAAKDAWTVELEFE